MLLIIRDAVIRFDQNLFLLINNGLENKVNDLFLGFITLLGYTHVLLPIAAIYIYRVDKKKIWENILTFVLAVLVGAILLHTIKEVVARARPLKEMEFLLSTGKIHIHNIFFPLRENSFPSGHTQLAFTTATFLALINKKHIFYLFLVAFLIGLSRIYVGVHFPLDVICGAALGTVSTIFVVKAKEKYIK